MPGTRIQVVARSTVSRGVPTAGEPYGPVRLEGMLARPEASPAEAA
jgi:hypothetical protein